MALDLGLPIGTGQRKPPQSLDTIKKRIVGDIDISIKAVKAKREPKAKWLLADGEQFRVSVRYGIVMVLFAKGMERGNGSVLVGTKQEAITKVWNPVKSAIQKGELDKEITAAWEKAKKIGTSKANPNKKKATKSPSITIPSKAERASSKGAVEAS